MTFVNRVFNHSCETMSEIPDGSVHCVVTSPPYFGLRDYGVDGQIGLEETLGEYVDKIVSVFREVKRVLRPDGTAWLNLGDSYGTGSGRNDTDPKNLARRSAKYGAGTGENTGPRSFISRKNPFKPKDLLMTPHRVAMALQSDGWWARDAIIWHKPNPMPSSVTDRCTPSYELLFMLAKSAQYYADMDAVKEPLKEPDATGIPIGGKKLAGGDNATYSGNLYDASAMQGANLRNVWTIATEPYAGAHFATMPREIVRRCILIGSPANGIVLDPFMGSGTVAEVALGCGRQYVGYELNPEYIDLIRDRLGLFGAA